MGPFFCQRRPQTWSGPSNILGDAILERRLAISTSSISGISLKFPTLSKSRRDTHIPWSP